MARKWTWNRYNRAHEKRVGVSHPSIKKIRKPFMKGVFVNFLLLQALFLGMFAYIFGALYTEVTHLHNIKVLYVDYDGGVIGQAVRDAYQNLKGKSFPTLVERSSDEFATPDDLREQVCKIHYWMALYVTADSSQRLENALAGGSAASAYNGTNVMSYIWNEARYPTFVDAISADVQMISSAARVAYLAKNGTGALQNLDRTNRAAVDAFTNPWQLQSVNIQPTAQGSRTIYNTLVIILIIIQEFFYIGSMNALYGAFHVYERLHPHRIIYFRFGVSAAYTFVGSLCVAGMIWAFRSGWDVNGNQFVLSWLVLWLFAHVNFLWLDAFTVWLPPSIAPMSLIVWVVTNVTGILYPFEVSPGFFKWAFAMPGHEVWTTLIDIWSRGCYPQLHIALPVLFTWEVLGIILAVLGCYRRCHYAVIAADEREAEFKAQLAEAMSFEKEHDSSRAAEEKATRAEVPAGLEPVESPEERDEEDARDRVQMTAELRRLESLASSLRRSQSTKSRSFGPSFGFQVAKPQE